MRLVVNHQARAATGSGSPIPRVRPGERPVWCDASVESSSWGRWRAAAAASGLGLDVWVALLLELRFVRDDMLAAGVERPDEV